VKYISYSRLPSNIYWYYITQPTHKLYFVIIYTIEHLFTPYYTTHTSEHLLTSSIEHLLTTYYITHTWEYISYSRLPSNIYSQHIIQPTRENIFHTHIFHRTSTHNILYNPHEYISYSRLPSNIYSQHIIQPTRENIFHTHVFHRTSTHNILYNPHVKIYFILTSSIEHLLTSYTQPTHELYFVIMHYRIYTHPTQYTTHYMRSDKKMYFIDCVSLRVLTSSIEHLLTTYYTTHTLIYIS
jgi:hypothetical protein